jgi:hypothetical protein
VDVLGSTLSVPRKTKKFDRKFFEETDQDFRNPWIYSLTSNGLINDPVSLTVLTVD